MLAIKKINNNVAVCKDGNGCELIAFGKGIGFPQMPYEIKLENIDRTFYNISAQYMGLMNELPMDIIEFTMKILPVVQSKLDYDLNPNLVLTLADHLAFAMERERKKIYIEMPLIYDMEQQYPMEMKLSRYIVAQMDKVFHVKLKRNELSGIAMSIISAKITSEQKTNGTDKIDFEGVLKDIGRIIEKELHIVVNKESFDYARFATHIKYLLDRICSKQYIDTDNITLYQNLREEFADISTCVDCIIEYLNQKLDCEVTEEEKMYLILHVNRICSKEKCAEETEDGKGNR